MEPLVILVVLPILIGIASEMQFRDTKKASLAAALASALVVCLCVNALDPHETWSWVAALLVSPLPIAFAVIAVLICYGGSQDRRRKHRHRALA